MECLIAYLNALFQLTLFFRITLELPEIFETGHSLALEKNLSNIPLWLCFSQNVKIDYNKMTFLFVSWFFSLKGWDVNNFFYFLMIMSVNTLLNIKRKFTSKCNVTYLIFLSNSRLLSIKDWAVISQKCFWHPENWT